MVNSSSLFGTWLS